MGPTPGRPVRPTDAAPSWPPSAWRAARRPPSVRPRRRSRTTFPGHPGRRQPGRLGSRTATARRRRPGRPPRRRPPDDTCRL